MIDPRFDTLRALLRAAGWTHSADNPQTFENLQALAILENSLGIVVREGRTEDNPAFEQARNETARLCREMT